MSLMSRLVAWVAKLPPAETYDVVVEKDIPIQMPDGVTLMADHYYPRTGGPRPTILVRSPYGRRRIFGLQYGQVFAERGFQVLIQSCRGTADSGGELNPFHQERTDGLATVAWIKQQPWFNGQLATNGGSYLGYVQWAIAAEIGPELKAMAAQVTTPDLRRMTYPGGAFALDNTIGWTSLTANQTRSGPDMTAGLLGSNRKKIEAVFKHLPLRDADLMAVGRRVQFWQDWLEHDQLGDDWWKPQDYWAAVSNVTAPAHLLGGWYDVFLPDTIGLYQVQRRTGLKPALIIGPWTHTDFRAMSLALGEALAWFRAHLLGDRSGLREKPVRIYVMSASGGAWRDDDDWPPPGYPVQRWQLQSGRGLSPQTPDESQPDRYRYDPADPTPAVGGVTLGQNSGPRDQRTLEARADVLTYTSVPLDRDLEVIGPVQAELFVKSSLPHTDFFVSLCDVHPSGKSINICDGLLRVVPGRPAPEADGCIHLCMDLWPTAYRFQRGHRLRLQVSSGAHPRYARNPGSGEPLAAATTLKAADQAVYHDPAHPSAILLPVKGA